MTAALSIAILQRLRLDEDSRGSAWTSFSDTHWHRALRWLDWNGMAIYFLEATRSSSESTPLPESVRKSLEERAEANSRRSTAILEESDRLVRGFRARGVRYALLKGIALTPDYCPAHALRTQYDHDVLVGEDSLQEAAVVLEGEGYRRKPATHGEATIVYRRPDPPVRFSDTSEALYSPLLNRAIELHLRLWEDEVDRVRVSLPGDFLQRTQCRQLQDLQYTALSDEDELLFQVLHAFKHILHNWCRLSIFLEIACLLRRRFRDAAFWNRFTERIGAMRWARDASLTIFALCERLFGAPLSAKLREAIETPRSPALLLWVERYGAQAAFSNFHDDKYSLFLHREFVENPQDWRFVLSKRLFPAQRPHRPPPVVFQRGFSTAGRILMEKAHAFRRLQFHASAGLRYTLAYPRWRILRRMAMPVPESAQVRHV